MARAAALLAAFLLAPPASAAEPARVTILHFSDDHAHAVPFYASGQPGVGGIARAIRFLAPLAKEPGTLVLSGGDMLNKGAPAWSDKYRCETWSWWNGIVGAMALGNHDADYGPEVFASCRTAISYPILSANAVDAAGRPLFPPTAAFDRSGVRIGVFAVAGPDFEGLVKPGARAVPGLVFADRIAAAREAVRTLRKNENAAAVVMIGHEQHDDDVALARAVPGIDLILGTHSHLSSELERIPGTATWTISSGQYLEFVSRVELTFREGRLADVTGRLVWMGPGRPEDREVRARVAGMQAALVADPEYAPLFVRVAHLTAGLATDGALRGNSPLGGFVAEAMRAASGAKVALTTASSIREPLPPGEIVEEQLRAALPYPNRILVYELTGASLARLLEASAAKAGTDLFCQGAGLPAKVDGAATYRLATTDFFALTAEPYRTILAGLSPRETGLDVRGVVRKALAASR